MIWCIHPTQPINSYHNATISRQPTRHILSNNQIGNVLYLMFVLGWCVVAISQSVSNVQSLTPSVLILSWWKMDEMMGVGALWTFTNALIIIRQQPTRWISVNINVAKYGTYWTAELYQKCDGNCYCGDKWNFELLSTVVSKKKVEVCYKIFAVINISQKNFFKRISLCFIFGILVRVIKIHFLSHHIEKLIAKFQSIIKLQPIHWLK